MSRQEALEQFGSYWGWREDSRRGNAALHDFHELLMIALCCVLGDGRGAVDMAVFAEAKEPFLSGSLTLAKSLPSHDTFSRLFRNLDPDQFRDSFQRFMAQFSWQLLGVVTIDAKGLRRSLDRASGKSARKRVVCLSCPPALGHRIQTKFWKPIAGLRASRRCRFPPPWLLSLPQGSARRPCAYRCVLGLVSLPRYRLPSQRTSRDSSTQSTLPSPVG
jgi:hypothetical protein